MPKKKTKLRLKDLDKLCSLIVRTRDNWTCVLCHKKYLPPTAKIQCSHFWSRRHTSTRFDLPNLDALCAGCHLRVEANKQGDYREFKIQQLGLKEYNNLDLRHKEIHKVNQSYLQDLREELQDKAKELGLL